MSAAANALVVVSYYDARPRHELDALLRDLAEVDAGAPFDTLVVVNQSSAAPTAVDAPLRGLRVLHRPNAGYNIGAWDHGWRAAPGYAHYVFVQHECRVRRPGWLAAYLRRLQSPDVGLVGERANPAWASPWAELERRFAGHTLPDHGPGGAVAERLPTYRACWRRWGIAPGERGDHLQTLVLAARGDTLARIDGFPVGANYGEAIAAEIGVSKRVQMLGLTTEEMGPRPFAWITHPQWQDKAAAQPLPTPRLSLQRWLDERRADAAFVAGPWLVLGKGPTVRRLSEAHRAQHRLFALNHVVREVAVDVAHAIDVDVVLACREVLADRCRWLVMPRVPHVGDKPGARRLEEWFEEVPELWELERQGRLVWYNCSTAPPLPGSPVVDVRYFSSEAAFGVLGLLGVRAVRTLGVDGGRQYAPAFDDLAGTTRLRNGQSLFDRQFERLAAIAQAHGIDWRPLVTPPAIAVRADAADALAAQVLEHTLRRHASQPLAIVRLPLGAAAPAGACAVGAAALAVADPAADDAVAPPAHWLAPVPDAPWLAPHGPGAAAWLDAFADAGAARSVAPAAVRLAVRRRFAHPDLLRPERWPPAADEAAALRREVAALLLSRAWQLGGWFVQPAAAALRRWRRRAR
ncbi:MAG: hypothetical protein ACK6D1_00745 [Planctomycetota bacterium]